MKEGDETMNCHVCIHSRPIPGDAHRSCCHPLVIKAFEEPAIDAFMSILGSPNRKPIKTVKSEGLKTLNIEAHPHGVANGWCYWPINFDGVWIRNCDGFETKEEAEVYVHSEGTQE